MIIFGSGGHTGEMLLTFKNFNFQKFDKIYFVKAFSDLHSKNKVETYFNQTNESLKIHQVQKRIQWIDIPRSREVKQSYISSVFTTLYALTKVLCFIIYYKVDILVSNGPGTSIPVIFVYILKNYILLFKRKTQIIFIESWCRVKELSLSGKLVYLFADRFIVHWEKLSNKYKKCEFLGKFI